MSESSPDSVLTLSAIYLSSVESTVVVAFRELAKLLAFVGSHSSAERMREILCLEGPFDEESPLCDAPRVDRLAVDDEILK